MTSRTIALIMLIPVATVMAAIQPLVPTTSGRLVGQQILVTNDQKQVYQFLGVPYARPPVAELRFERPQPFNGTEDQLTMAQTLKPTCMQMKHLTKAINPLLDVDQIHNISEDCLYLNIYVPGGNHQPESLPVMVWLPGEGFDFADARQFNGAYLAALGQVIVVTVQYRVGAFGFLKDNAGLWDQLLALRWVQDNAGAFGGNARDVTLFGRFTGSMSISILLSSPQVRDAETPLFKRAIMMSGIAVANWVFDHRHQDKVQQLINSEGCSQLECLKQKPAHELLAKSGYGWKPYFDGQLIQEEPMEAVRKGRLSPHLESLILGTNQFEGTICLLKHLATDEPFYTRLIRNQATPAEIQRIVLEDLEMFYGNQDVARADNLYRVSDRDSYLQFCSDLLIESHVRQYESLVRDQNRNVYAYKLDYKPSFSIAPAFINSSIHGDDVLLAFGLAFKNPFIITADDGRVSRHMVHLFSDFARRGLSYPDSNRNHIIQSAAENFWSTARAVLFSSAFGMVAAIVAIVALMGHLMLRSIRRSNSLIKNGEIF